MMYLSGKVRADLVGPYTGFMLTRYVGNALPPEAAWAADSGCYTHPHDYSLDRYLAWLRHFSDEERGRCLFATAPDVPFDAAATSERSVPLLPVIRECGYPVAFCAQDGHAVADLPWDDLDCLFIGGSTRWKLGDEMAALHHEAQRRGKWTHMGRVNGPVRIKIALAIGLGFDSVDGTVAAFAPDKYIPLIHAWMADQGTVQTRMAFADNPPINTDGRNHE